MPAKKTIHSINYVIRFKLPHLKTLQSVRKKITFVPNNLFSMKRNTKILLLIVIVLLILGMAFYPKLHQLYISKNQAESAPAFTTANRNKALNVNVQVMQPETLNDLIHATGSLIPDEEVDLSFETSGKITDIYFKEGSSVKKGDLLAKVNDSPLQAELKKLEAQVPLAEDRLYRQKALLAKDAVSKETYEQVSTELEKLKADIELIKARIAQTELRAPFDGEIGLRLVSEGTYASPSTIVARLTKIIPLKVEFSTTQELASQITPGVMIRFALNNASRAMYQASVYAVESSIEMKTRSLKARAIYPNPGGHLKPGSAISIEINLKEIKNALTVPSEAIVAEMGLDIAYRYHNNKAQRVEVVKGLRTASRVQVLQGLEQGDTVITTGVMQLRDGMAVTIDKILNEKTGD